MAKASKDSKNHMSLQGRLLAAVSEAESWDEAKLLLVMDGWDVVATDVADAIKRILLGRQGMNKTMNVFMHSLTDGPAERQMQMADMLKGIWTDVVGLKDNAAAKNMFFRLNGMLDWMKSKMLVKTSVNIYNNVMLNVLGELTVWFGQLAWPKGG